MSHPRANGKLSWKPKRSHSSTGRYDVYCSPACGHGCLRSDYEKAVLAAVDLAMFHLEGDWIPEVVENFGWHWKVTKGKAEIRLMPSGKNYSCHLNTQPPRSCSGPTPQAALDMALSQARTALTTLQEDIKELSGTEGIR